jgi:hypothetical protein
MSILKEANTIIYGDREKTYGHPSKNLVTRTQQRTSTSKRPLQRSCYYNDGIKKTDATPSSPSALVVRNYLRN